MKKRIMHDFTTLNGEKETNQSCTDSSAYAVLENPVVVSSFPVNNFNHQETVVPDESYSVLDRQNNTVVNKANNNTEYDSLNHSNRGTVANTNGNIYSSVNAACVTKQNIASNAYGIYQ
jgi:hypothetical protein